MKGKTMIHKHKQANRKADRKILTLWLATAL